MWFVFALLSAVFAALTSILAKIGIDGVNSNLATAIRTMVVVAMAWGMVFITNAQHGLSEISRKSWLFLVLSGLAGLRLENGRVIAEPLFEPEDLAWFCADGVRLGDRFVTLLWDRDGTRYGKGPGLRLLVDGEEKASAPGIGTLKA